MLPEAVHDKLLTYEKQYMYIPCNVQEKVSLQSLWDTSLARWSGIDIWINNAGQNTTHRVL